VEPVRRARWGLGGKRLTDEELDCALATANADLMAYLRGTVDPDDTLLAIMDLSIGDNALPGVATCQFDSTGRRIADIDAVSIVMARTLAREVDRDLCEALMKQSPEESGALDLVERSMRLAVRAVGDVESTETARYAVGLAALALDVDIILDLARHLAYCHHAYSRDAELVQDLGERDLERAESLAWSFRLDRPADDHPSRVGLAVQITIETARTVALRLISALDSIEVDGSQADFSKMADKDLDVFGGVVWTSLTVWPIAVKDQIRSRSQQVSPGVYRVQRQTASADRSLAKA